MSTRVLSLTDIRGAPVHSPRAKRPRITPSEESVSRVKRCLFGARNPDEAFSAIEAAQAAIQQSAEANLQKYNFDFLRDAPLRGRFQWISDPKQLRQSHITDFMKVSKNLVSVTEKTTCRPEESSCPRDSCRDSPQN